ncbi:hypothetical protein N9924_01285 [bacterium]|nr:hypothetical protein [bacterium]
MTEDLDAPRGLLGAGAKNAAAFLSLNTPDPVETYRQVSEELEAGISETQDMLRASRLEERQRQNTTVMSSIVQDQTLNDDEKLAAVNAIRDEQEEGVREITMSRAISQPSGDETGDRENQRVDFAPHIKEANEYAEFKQQVLNASASQMDFSGLSGYGSVFASFIPYVREVAADDAAERLAETGFISPEDANTFFLFAGENMVAIRDAMKKMSIEERTQMAEGLVSMMEDESSIMFAEPNQAVHLDMARTLLEDGYYTNTDRWIDNALGVLDVLTLGISSGVRTGARSLVGFKTAGIKETAGQLLSRGRRNSVAGTAQPASPTEAIKEVNPDKARAMHQAVVEDETGEVATVLKGVDRDTAIVDDVLADVVDDAGTTRNFPSNMDRTQQEVEHSLSMAGRTELSEAEKISARDTFLQRLTRPKFLNYRSAQSQIGQTPDGGVFRMSTVFGETQDAGFQNLDDAVQAAVDQAHRFGLTSDSIKIQARTGGGDYVDLDNDMAVAAARGEGSDFLVKFDFDYNVNPTDVSRWEEADVNQKLFGFINPDGWFPQAGGQLTRWMKDATSIFDKRIAGAGLAIEDRSSRIQKLLLEDMAQVEGKIKSLSMDEQEKLHQHVVHANREGQAYNATELRAEGFSPEAVEAVQSFRNFWDRDWRLNNAVKRKQLQGDGIVVLEDSALGTKLYGKPNAEFIKTLPKQNVKVYDMDTDDFKTITSNTELDEFFGESRMIYKLEQPLDIDGSDVKWVIGNERSHVRPLNDSDDIIPYREGYYKVNYTDSFFLEKRTTDEWGEVISRAVQSSDKASTMLRAAKRMNEENIDDSIEYVARNDVKDVNDIRRMRDDSQAVSDGFRQYHRGERLGNAERPIDDAEVENPIDAMKRSAGSVSRRMAYGDWIQSTKARFMSQYGEVVEKQGGKTIFPTHPRFIATENLDNKKLADEARTTWEYISFMENVRMNFGSAMWKYGLKSMEETFGRPASRGRLLGKAGETAARLAGTHIKPIEASKKVAFEAAVVFNPARQLFLGVFDVLTKGPLHGIHFAKGIKDAPSMVAANMAIHSTDPEVAKKWMKVATGISGRSEVQIKEMLDQFHQSGLVAAIDKQAMMAAGLHTEVERASVKAGKVGGALGKAQRTAANGYEKVRSIPYKGFEYNEYMTQGIIWASRYNQVLSDVAKTGRKTLNKQELEGITSYTRNLNYGQNRAGEMAYNTSALGALFQFIQIPHKALMLISPQAIGGSKMLNAKQKAALTTTALALYGTPEDFFGVDIAGGITANIEDEELRDTLRHGLAWNAFFNIFDASISTRELSPFDAEAIADKFVSIFNGTPFADSPAAQFAWPRVTEAMRHATAVWGVGYQDYSTQEKFGSIASKWFEISSGYSNTMKSLYAAKHGEFVSGKGWLSDPHVNGAEAMLKFWGVRSLDEQEIFETQQNLKKFRKDALDDVRVWYQDYKKSRISLGDDSRQVDFINRSFAELWRVYKDTPAFESMQKELRKMVKIDAKQGETKLMRDMLRSIEVISPDDMKGMFNVSGLSQDEIKAGHKFVDDVNDINLYLGTK